MEAGHDLSPTATGPGNVEQPELIQLDDMTAAPPPQPNGRLEPEPGPEPGPGPGDARQAEWPPRLELGSGEASPAAGPRPVVWSPWASATSNGNVRRRSRRDIWMPRHYHKWKSPVLNVLFFLAGLGTSIGHCAWYAHLNTTIVPSASTEQENNLRIGTALAFLSQISLAASVWQTYTQWMWRSIKNKPVTIPELNDMFGVDTSVLSFLNINMLRNFRIGSLIALFAWCLILPPFFTPGTLFVSPSTHTNSTDEPVPYLTIADSFHGHNYSYSPSNRGDSYELKNLTSRIFSGPRTVLTLLGSATASQGVILPLRPPHNRSSYSVEFYGPAVRCAEAAAPVQLQISDVLRAKMAVPAGTATEKVNAYYAFVPSVDAAGVLRPLDQTRYQTPLAASNELWMVFQRYVEPAHETCEFRQHFQVCQLWNASYHLDLAWDNGFQNITGHRAFLHTVDYPPLDGPDDVSDMAQHAYSAFFWVLADQTVGSFGWFTDASVAAGRGFGRIASPIQHNSLLGSSDLDVFFNFNENSTACRLPYANLTAQRRQDKDLAKDWPLDALIEQLSFNMTVSLMHNDLLTLNTTATVTNIEDVNRYGYNREGLIIPYALACGLTLLTVAVGLGTNMRHRAVFPDKKFQDILAGAVDPGAIQLARDPYARRHSMTVDLEGAHLTFRVQNGQGGAPG